VIEALIRQELRLERAMRFVRWMLAMAIVLSFGSLLLAPANRWVAGGVVWMVAAFGSLLMWSALHRRPSPSEPGAVFLRQSIEIRMRWALWLRWVIVGEAAGLLAIMQGMRKPKWDDLGWISVLLMVAWVGPSVMRNRARKDIAMLGF